MSLNTGDIAIVAYNADGTDSFSFVALVDISAGEVIKFTDNGWLSTNAFRMGEGIITWTAPSGGVSAGSVVTITTTPSATVGTVSEVNDLNFSAAGDQIVVYQGSEASPTFLFALNNDGAGVWQATAVDTNTSALPTGLIEATSAVALSEIDNARYSGVTAGTREELLAAIANRANWVGDDAANQTPPTSFSVQPGTPMLSVSIVDATISENGGSSLATVTRSGSTSGDLVVTLASDDTSEATVPTTVTILDGQSSATFTVSGVDDALIDGTQTVTVTASAAGFSNGADTLDVLNDDASSVASVTINDVFAAEGDSETSILTFTVSRGVGTGAFSVDFATANGTATAGVDYLAATGTLSFLENETSKSISITVNGDLAGETSETLTVNLTNATNGAAIVDAQGVGTIVDDDFTLIHDVQGTAFWSPILAAEGILSYNVASTATVTVEGIVTAIDDAGSLQGFFIQEEVADWDGDSRTSEGIFVMTRNDSSVGSTVSVAAPGLAIGERVQITANVIEYQSFSNLPRTFLTSATIVQSDVIVALPTLVLDGSAGRAIPNAILSNDNPVFTDSVDDPTDTFDPESDALDFFETVEGMLVQLPNMRVADGFVEGSNDENRFKAYSTVHADAGQINSRGGYTINGDPALSAPDTATTDDGVIRGGRHLHDGDTNPDIIELDFSGAGIGGTTAYHNLLDMGDSLGDVTGVIDFDFTEVKLYVTEQLSAGVVAALDDQSPAQEITTLVADDRSLRVATFNVENLGGDDASSRFTAIADAIKNNLLSPDIISIEEIQDNNGATNSGETDASTTWNALVAAVNAATGKTYQWVDEAPSNNAEGGEPGGNIRVGFLYDTARVQLGDLAANASITDRRMYVDRIGDGVRTAGDLISFTDADVAGQINTADWSGTRRSLLGEFTFNGQTVYVTANHFPSKGGSEAFWQLNQDIETGHPTNADWTQRNEVSEDVWSTLDFIAQNTANALIISGGDFNDFYFYRPLEVATGSVDADGVARTTGTLFTNLTVSELVEAERYTYTFDGRNQAIDHVLVSGPLAAVADYDVVHLNTGYSGRTGAFNPAISDHDPAVARFDFRNFAETLAGTSGADSINGFGGADTLRGGDGADTLFGGADGDALFGDAASDLIIGQDGADVLTGGGGADVFLILNPIESVILGADVILDFVAFEDQLNIFFADQGRVAIKVEADHRDVYFGDNGSGGFSARASVYGTEIQAPDLATSANGVALLGADAADVLIGGAGADFVYGDAGADVLVGQGGADILLGGAAADMFFFGGASDSAFSARDQIFGFESGSDAINVFFADQGQVAIRYVEGHSEVYFGNLGDGNFSAMVEVYGDLVQASDVLASDPSVFVFP